MEITNELKQRIGTQFDLPVYPNNLPTISEVKNKEGINYFNDKIYRVNWKDDGLLKSILFETDTTTVIGTYIVENESDEFPKLIQYGEWIEIDKKNRIKSITLFNKEGNKIYHLFKVQNNLFVRTFQDANNWTTEKEEFIPVYKRKKAVIH